MFFIQYLLLLRLLLGLLGRVFYQVRGSSGGSAEVAERFDILIDKFLKLIICIILLQLPVHTYIHTDLDGQHPNESNSLMVITWFNTPSFLKQSDVSVPVEDRLHNPVHIGRPLGIGNYR